MSNETGKNRPDTSLSKSPLGRILHLLGVVSLRAVVGVAIWMFVVVVVIAPQNGLVIHPARILHNPIRLFTTQDGFAIISIFAAYWAAVWVYIPVKAALSSLYTRVTWALSAFNQNTPLETNDEEL
jgi:hypothetical protein